MSGKGSKPRPFAVSNEEYANRWDAIFGRDKTDQKKAEDMPKTLNEVVEKSKAEWDLGK